MIVQVLGQSAPAAGPNPPSRSQSRKVTPGGAVQSSTRVRGRTSAWRPARRRPTNRAGRPCPRGQAPGCGPGPCSPTPAVGPNASPSAARRAAGELANAATSTGPIACSNRQRAGIRTGPGCRRRRPGTPGPMRCRTSSGGPTDRARGRRILHRDVPRQVEHAPGRAYRVEAVAAKVKATAAAASRRAVRSRPVTSSSSPSVSGGRRAELKLPARLDRERSHRREEKEFDRPNGRWCCSGSGSPRRPGWLPSKGARVAATCSARTGRAGSPDRGLATRVRRPLVAAAPGFKAIPRLRLRVGFAAKPRPLDHDFNTT